MNLLSNAVKYNFENGAIILDSEVVDDQRLRISITDTGEGLSEGDIAKLFNSFERLNTKFNVEGVGIGLVIAKNIIEGMGGAIGVTSILGKGSTFWIELVLVNKNKFNDDAVYTETVINNEEKPSTSNEKIILCIDDNLVNLTLIESVIEQASNYRTISTTDAVTGLKIAEEKQPDLILMDINMPEINGYEALIELQNNKNIYHIPVIAVTGNATKEDIDKGLSAGFKKYITKPFGTKDLINAIDEELFSEKKEV